MKAADQLRKEHEAVGLALRILSRFRKRLEQEEPIDKNDLEKMVEFLDVFVDKCHFGKEEDLLIPKLRTKEGIDNQFLNTLLAEHVIGRGYIQDIKDALGDLVKNGEAGEQLTAGITSLINFLKDHASKEDNELFRLADTCLTETEQEALYEEFEILETERTGPGKHEELHEYLHEMKNKYL